MNRLNVRWIIGSAACALALICMVTPLTVQAQAGKSARAKQPAASRTPATAERPPREVTLTGRVVSVHAYMTGQADDEATKTISDGLRAGGTAALETPTGLIVLGQGNTGGMRVLLPLANEQVEAHGRLYEKAGVKFLDFDTVQAAAQPEEEAEEEAAPEEEEEEESPDEE